MDTRLSDALAFANYRLTLQIQRKNIDASFAASMVVSYQSAIFKVTPELISFVSIKVGSAVLLVEDQSGNVITIANAVAFLDLLLTAYDTAMLLKQSKQQKLKSARTTSKIVGL